MRRFSFIGGIWPRDELFRLVETDMSGLLENRIENLLLGERKLVRWLYTRRSNSLTALQVRLTGR